MKVPEVLASFVAPILLVLDLGPHSTAGKDKLLVDQAIRAKVVFSRPRQLDHISVQVDLLGDLDGLDDRALPDDPDALVHLARLFRPLHLVHLDQDDPADPSQWGQAVRGETCYPSTRPHAEAEVEQRFHLGKDQASVLDRGRQRVEAEVELVHLDHLARLALAAACAHLEASFQVTYRVDKAPEVEQCIARGEHRRVLGRAEGVYYSLRRLAIYPDVA